MNPNLSFFKILDGMEMFYKGLRSFFVSCIYIANKKMREGLSLLEYSKGFRDYGINILNELKG